MRINTHETVDPWTGAPYSVHNGWHFILCNSFWDMYDDHERVSVHQDDLIDQYRNTKGYRLLRQLVRTGGKIGAVGKYMSITKGLWPVAYGEK